MKKILQVIAFGISIITASIEITYAMKATTAQTEDQIAQGIKKITRPLNPSKLPNKATQAFAKNGINIETVHIMDGKSIIRGIVPETEQVTYLKMLNDPKNTMDKFYRFHYAGQILFLDPSRTQNNIFGDHVLNLIHNAIKRNSIFREMIVSFLAVFEMRIRENPKFHVMFEENDRVINSLSDDCFYVCLKSPSDNQPEALFWTAPFLFNQKEINSDQPLQYEFKNAYEYHIFHEFGHGIDFLLSKLLFNNSNMYSLTSKVDISERFCKIPNFAEDLLFGKWFFKTQETVIARNYFINEINQQLQLPDNENLTIPLTGEHLTADSIVKYASNYQRKSWEAGYEIFQIAGLSFYEDMIIVNKISDLNYFISNNVPFRWWHKMGDIAYMNYIYKFTLIKTLDSLKYSLTEDLVKTWYYLHETDFEKHRKAVFISQNIVKPVAEFFGSIKSYFSKD